MDRQEGAYSAPAAQAISGAPVRDGGAATREGDPLPAPLEAWKGAARMDSYLSFGFSSRNAIPAAIAAMI